MAATRLQSAMEYLMTYGWAILIVAVSLGALYQLGVFGTNSSALAPACLSSAGFLCQSPTLNTSGYLGIKFGEIGTSSITISNIACTTNTTAPSSTNSVSLTLESGQTAIVAFSCPLTINSIGSPFKGYLWMTYNTPTQSGLVDRVAVVTSKVSTTGNVIAILGGGLSAGGGGSPAQYIYCVGPATYTFTATLSSGTVGTWVSTNSYPVSMSRAGCSISGGYIYCVGTTTSPSTQVYSAPIFGNAIGTWTAQTSYPSVTMYAAGCSTDGSYLYCVGNYGAGTQVYTASINSGTVGTWTSTTSYPGSGIYNSGCNISGGYIYCVGNTNLPRTQVYSATASGGVVGGWSSQTAYPVQLYLGGCSIYGGYIYCVGGTNGVSDYNYVYSAPISSGTVGAWTAQTNYPFVTSSTGCVINNGYIYCVGAGDTPTYDQVYSAQVSSGTVGAWTVQTSYGNGGYAFQQNYCAVSDQSGGYLG